MPAFLHVHTNTEKVPASDSYNKSAKPTGPFSNTEADKQLLIKDSHGQCSVYQETMQRMFLY